MTSRIVEQLYILNEQIRIMNEILLKMDKKLDETDNEITQLGDWVLENTSKSNPHDEDIIVTIYSSTPKEHKIYQTTLNNIYIKTKDYVVILDETSDKVEMINKDYVYKIIIDVKEETEEK